MSEPPEIRRYQEREHAELVALWEKAFPDDPPRNRGVVEFYRRLGYAVEDRVSLGKAMG